MNTWLFAGTMFIVAIVLSMVMTSIGKIRKLVKHRESLKRK
ncbi:MULTISPECIES: hypothetical protein [Bacillus cereus group]|nr:MULTISPECIES: hypothetical protein [Bacillus cereus group]MED1560111.1 hypothetical protein [Bacillus paramycoides]